MKNNRCHHKWFKEFLSAFVVISGNISKCKNHYFNRIQRTLHLQLLILAFATFLLTSFTLTIVHCNTDIRPVVVFRVDDCQSNWLTPFNGLAGMNGLEYGKLKHIPITWGVITSLATNGTSLTWAQIKDYLDTAGGEPASHSVSHKPLSGQQSYISELIDSKAIIEANLSGYKCNTFLQPGSWADYAYMDAFSKLHSPLGEAIQANYVQSMAYLGWGWQIGNPYYLYGITNMYSIDAQNYSSIPGLLATLDLVASTPGLIYVVSTHGIQEQGKTTDYNVPADVLKAFMDKLADLRDQGKIRLMSLNDAYAISWPTDINHVPDPGFENCNPGTLNPKGPWRLSSSAQILDNGGTNNSRCVLLQDGNSLLSSFNYVLAPGRYVLSWYQKTNSELMNSKGLYAFMNNYGPPGYSNPLPSMDYTLYHNTNFANWEQKTAILLIKDELPIGYVAFQPPSGGQFMIDDVSLVSAPVDPAVSPSGSTVSAAPNTCLLSWNCPNDPSVTSIVVRYNGRTHPLKPSDGKLITTMPAQPGNIQQVSAPFAWSSLFSSDKYCFISIFAVKSDGSYSPPDLAWIAVDKTPPSTPVITVNLLADNTVCFSWTSSDSDSGVADYEYAVGNSQGQSDIIH